MIRRLDLTASVYSGYKMNMESGYHGNPIIYEMVR